MKMLNKLKLIIPYILLVVFVFIGLWIGYRNNQIADDQKKLDKITAEEERKVRLEKYLRFIQRRNWTNN